MDADGGARDTGTTPARAGDGRDGPPDGEHRVPDGTDRRPERKDGGPGADAEQAPDPGGPLAAVAAVEDPTRRALYDLVSGRETTSRDEAAAALGLPRSTAAFHLDRLVDAGLLEASFRRTGQRQGPGAGRPAKLYRRSAVETTVSVPPRRYELAAEIFARAIVAAEDSGQPVRAELRRAAAEVGRAAGERSHDFLATLNAEGYEPRGDAGGGVVMGNCPFHRLAQRHTDLVCELNYELLRGVVDGVPGCAARVEADPGAGRCCVRAFT